jgi:hypothetical protein
MPNGSVVDLCPPWTPITAAEATEFRANHTIPEDRIERYRAVRAITDTPIVEGDELIVVYTDEGVAFSLITNPERPRPNADFHVAVRVLREAVDCGDFIEIN